MSDDDGSDSSDEDDDESGVPATMAYSVDAPLLSLRGGSSNGSTPGKALTQKKKKMRQSSEKKLKQ